MRIELSTCILRTWTQGDAESMTKHANDREVWLHLRDYFPHPYTQKDAEAYLAHTITLTPPTGFAIEVDGHACGGISAVLQRDVHRLTAEIGYWLGRSYWGQGIMTEAVGAFTGYLLKTFGLERVFAVPFANNPASGRTLEKNGFILEGRMKRSAIKDGEVLDQFIYARTK